MKKNIYIIITILLGTTYFTSMPSPHGKHIVRKIFIAAFKAIRAKTNKNKSKSIKINKLLRDIPNDSSD